MVNINELNVGDIVCFSNTDISMTVLFIQGGTKVCCGWFDLSHVFHEHSFDPQCLRVKLTPADLVNAPHGGYSGTLRKHYINSH